jgi:putative spermidine/putrescine transport system permease protein
MAAVADVDTIGGSNLRRRLAIAERQGKLRALALVLPLFLFILVTFAAPVLYFLTRTAYDPVIAENLPRTIAELDKWDGKELPPESAFAALVADLKDVQAAGTAAHVAKRMNYEINAVRSKILASVRKAKSINAAPYKEQLIAADKIWADRLTWAKVKQTGTAINDSYVLGVLDRERDVDGNVVRVSEDRAVYISILMRTFYISLLVTLLTLVLGYPVAYILANSPERIASLLIILVLIPFWTSLLVRTTAWFVLLQDNGPINDALIAVGVANEPWKLVFSRFGTIIAMTHIQLPFTLLPIYSVMKGISPAYMRAARSLGGGPIYSFMRVYLPLTLPGVGAGCLLTLILSLGYYITPALVGGPADQMISGVIYDAMNDENNWGKASALGAMLLIMTLILFSVYNRLVGIDKVKLG